MTPVLIILAALLLDQLFGEPRHHPLVGFGRWAARVESRCRNDLKFGSSSRLPGVVALLAATIPPVILAGWLSSLDSIGGLFSLGLLTVCLGARSLADHIAPVEKALLADDLSAARTAVGQVVSRDSQQMTSAEVCRAGCETLLENGNDALFATLFWFLIGGAPLALLHRLVNTLDALWGYRTPEYYYFGWAAARLDDLMAWVPARLTALSYCLVGDYRQGRRCWQTQAADCASPNGGPVMAAGAGALNIRLGGQVRYHGEPSWRPQLGSDTEVVVGDLARTITLLWRSLLVWLGVIIVGGGLFA